jgi:uncharacterized protein DUF4255
MIDTTLVFLRDQLNGYLAGRYSSREPLVVVASLSNLDGTVPSGIDNRVVLTLVNVEREGAAGSTPHLRPEPGGFARLTPALHLNLYILVSASFPGNYIESLKLLSAVVGYFQGKPFFTPNLAGFPRGLEKLTMEIVNLDPQGLNNLWAGLGGKYLPSVLYKARMLTVQEGWAIDQIPAVISTDAKVGR